MNGYFDSEDDTPPLGPRLDHPRQERHHRTADDFQGLEAAKVSALMAIADALGSLTEAITRATAAG